MSSLHVLLSFVRCHFIFNPRGRQNEIRNYRLCLRYSYCVVYRPVEANCYIQEETQDEQKVGLKEYTSIKDDNYWSRSII